MLENTLQYKMSQDKLASLLDEELEEMRLRKIKALLQ
jgi:hypothetical protein